MLTENGSAPSMDVGGFLFVKINTNERKKKMSSSTKNFTKKLTESAVMLALTLILSYFKLVDLPYGGSITLCSMLPTIFIAYRHGMLFGLGMGFANGLLQLLMGVSTLSYATSAGAAVAIVVLDYLLAFTVLGLGGIFKNLFKNQVVSIGVGAAFVCTLRYIFHVIAGCTVWKGLSIPDSEALIYSIAYNATYMLPELIITVVGAIYLASSVNLKSERLATIKKSDSTKSGRVLKNLGILGSAAAFIADIVLIAPKLQNADSGDFDITGITKVNFTTVIIITLVGVIWTAAFFLAAKYKEKNNN